MLHGRMLLVPALYSPNFVQLPAVASFSRVVHIHVLARVLMGGYVYDF
jgi:hypothetical protein